MQAHLEAQGKEVWGGIENGSFVPTSVANGMGTTNIKSLWINDDKKISLLQESEEFA